MIPIVAKDYESFFAICKSFSIPETEAIFIDGSIIEKEIPTYSPPIHETNVKTDGSDWLNYPVTR
jgi:hypothetical protein